jgi:hypothetical protein
MALAMSADYSWQVNRLSPGLVERLVVVQALGELLEE